ncbi:MAG: SDR family NAD(P)-dependent oxidoreductase [Bacteroidota bacterium]
MAKLSDKIALVTGGTGGLGSIVSQSLAREGAVVIVTHSGSRQSLQKLLNLQKNFSIIEGICLDATKEDSVQSSISDVFKRFGRIDILCNVVGGIGEKRLIEETPLSEWNEMMTVNLQSCFLMMKNVIPSMKKNGFGRIINIAAKTGVTQEAQRGGYGVSKAGVIALTETAAAEFKEFADLTVNAIAPSIIVTEENKRWGTEEQIQQWVTPDQIAQMIIHLCSDQGVAINGQIIHMYGKV